MLSYSRALHLQWSFETYIQDLQITLYLLYITKKRRWARQSPIHRPTFSSKALAFKSSNFTGLYKKRFLGSCVHSKYMSRRKWQCGARKYFPSQYLPQAQKKNLVVAKM